MAEKESIREKLIWEIETLNDEQVLEVLEYISIMKTLREQEVNSIKSKNEGTQSGADQEKAHQAHLHRSRESAVLIFPRSRRAASK